MDEGIEFENMDEFLAKIANVADEYPGTAEKHLRRTGNKLKRELVEASPDSGHDSKKKIKKMWRTKTSGLVGSELETQVYSKSPHFHLVDRGHVIKDKKGNTHGFVQGQHFLDKTVDKFQSSGEVEAELSKLAREIKRKMEG
jgi:hypothetical protein